MEPSIRYAEGDESTTYGETAPCPWESSYQTPGTVSRGNFSRSWPRRSVRWGRRTAGSWPCRASRRSGGISITATAASGTLPPSESTFSRAFAWFAETRLPERVHGALVRAAYEGSVVGHVSRDSTAIVGRERPAPKPGPERKPKRRRGRPRKGEEAVRQPTRLERQLQGGMSTAEMVGELPKARDVGTKRNAKGYKESWRGYKLHIDAADGDIPVSCILTSASLHDSQAAIPLARMTAERVDHRYELMDAVCDSREIGAHARLAGRVAIIDANPRRDAALRARLAGEALARRNAGHVRHDRVRYRQRSSVERVNSALKDSYGGRHVRVRGNLKVACHLFFGILALTVDRLMRLTI